MTKVDVLIVGAGPTGLMMASELLRYGLTCRIIDKEKTPKAESQEFAIQMRTLDVLRQANMVEPFLREGLKLPEIESIFTQHIKQKGLRVEREVELTGLRDRDAFVEATLVHHHSGAKETIIVDWVIGCDGAQSTVRKTIGKDLYQKGRVFLAGDAAQIGGGLDSAIQDAFNLGWKLAWVQQKKAQRKLLDSYQIERRPLKDNALRRFLRRFRGALQVGDFAPNGSVIVQDQATTLFETWRGLTKGIILLFAGDALDAMHQLETLGDSLEAKFPVQAFLITAEPYTSRSHRIVIDPGLKVHESYGVDEPSLYFIRPDLTIGYRQLGLSYEPIESYFNLT
jgi:2-polyprenyl-6-methoxyphenol hydroxylase-like FAD-dependent oxidoreductase